MIEHSFWANVMLELALYGESILWVGDEQLARFIPSGMIYCTKPPKGYISGGCSNWCPYFKEIPDTFVDRLIGWFFKLPFGCSSTMVTRCKWNKTS